MKIRKILILFLATLFSVSSNADSFLGVDFNKNFDPGKYEKIDSTKSSSFKYRYATQSYLDYDYVIRNSDVTHPFPYIGVVVEDNDIHKKRKRPYIVVGCSDQYNAQTLQKVISSKFSIEDKYAVTLHERSNLGHKYISSIGDYEITVSNTLSKDLKGCIEFKNLEQPSYDWLSNQDHKLRKIFYSSSSPSKFAF